ncbi:DUF58 domain-containing protein [Neptuniibacter sp. CAU 1671]|uniref:DUF58 domain-containing protein n=1 Tax=Neptuniibacter sp. CAU 1671 TaxID=3032593 RepID=UPI0023DCC20B|nr:DUF58 domain-containing protein [Neptuniibacter sp. CAU 1671]MDF2180445.1 DUF58 domain-containing protein [Neptuniibacter sp. CAU 1671]
MFKLEASPRPVPALRHMISLDELLSLRHWPPARAHSRERVSIREGQHLSHVRARGMEYDDVRQYQPGDDIRHLDWRLMARTGEAFTKLYREERERPVFFLADLRSSMHFATRGHFKSVLAAYASAMVIWTTLANGDRVGGSILTPEGARLFKPASHRQQAMQLIAALYEAFSAEQTEHLAEGPLTEHLLALEALLPTGSILYVFSDFNDVDATLQQHLMRMAQRFELKLVMISDPLEQQLPAQGQYRFCGEGRQVELAVTPQAQSRYASAFQTRLDLVEALMQIKGVELAHWQSNQHPLFEME